MVAEFIDSRCWFHQSDYGDQRCDCLLRGKCDYEHQKQCFFFPAIIEAILALAAGSIAGVGKAIERGLSMLLPLVINLFAKLIGLGGLAKRVMKIFKKIRKRIDKAVNKILAKAKKAGRKLMRKLGIGKKKDKKKKGDKDERSEKEMKADLNKGISEAEKFVENDENDEKQIKKKLSSLEDKYDLVSLKMVIDSKGENEEEVHVHGEVNPSKDSKKIKRRKKVKKGSLIHEKDSGAWSDYSLKVTKVVNQHKFFAKAKGQSEKQFNNKDLDSSWKKFNPYKRGEAWEAIKDGSKWSKYADARQVLNYRKHKQFNNPGGKDWHHIIEQNNPLSKHSVSNLGLVDEHTNRSTFNIFFNAVYPETGGLRLRDWLPAQGSAESEKWGRRAIFEAGKSLKKKDEGRGPYQEIE